MLDEAFWLGEVVKLRLCKLIGFASMYSSTYDFLRSMLKKVFSHLEDSWLATSNKLTTLVLSIAPECRVKVVSLNICKAGSIIRCTRTRAGLYHVGPLEIYWPHWLPIQQKDFLIYKKMVSVSNRRDSYSIYLLHGWSPFSRPFLYQYLVDFRLRIPVTFGWCVRGYSWPVLRLD